MSRIAQFIDESPLFKMLTDIIKEGPGRLVGAIGGALSRMGDAVANAMPEGGALGGIGDWMRGGEGASQSVAVNEPERTPQKEVSAPARSEDRFSVNMEDLGQFSAPSFTAIAPTQGQGMAV